MPSFKPEAIFHLGDIAITNSMFTAIIIFAILAAIIFIARSRFSLYKPGKLQIALEMLVGGLRDMAQGIVGHMSTWLVSLLITFFVVILVSNWFGLLPFVPTVGLVEAEGHGEKTEEVVAETEHKAEEKKEEGLKSESLNLGECFSTRKCVITLSGKTYNEAEILHTFRPPTADTSFTVVLALTSIFVVNAIGFMAKGFHYFKKVL